MSYTAAQLRAMGIPVPGEQEEDKPATPTGRRTYTGEELKELGIPLPSAPDPVEQPRPPVQKRAAGPSRVTLTGDQLRELGIPVPGQMDPASIHSRMWDGMTFEEAMQSYKTLTENPRVEHGLAGASFTDPTTGQRKIIPVPEADTSIGGLLWDAAKAPFTDVTLADAWRDNVSDPPATVSVGQNLHRGFQESYGAATEAGAAALDKAFGTDLLSDARRASLDYDTSHSTVDSLIADFAAPVAFSVYGGAGIAAITRGMALVPKIAARISGFLATEAAAASTVSSDEDLLFSRGVDPTNPDQAEEVLRHRMNTMIEGVALGSTMAGLSWTGRQVWGATGAKIIESYRHVTSPNAMEKDVFWDIIGKVSGIDTATASVERQAVVEDIAQMVADNKDAVVKSLTNAEETVTTTLDTFSAMLRGVPENERLMRNRIAGTAAGFANNPELTGFAASRTSAADTLADQLDQQARVLGGGDAAAQVATLDGAADGFAQIGREARDSAFASVDEARAAYDHATRNALSDASSDPTLPDLVKRLGDVVGTEVTAPVGENIRAMQEALETGYTTMKARKDELYSRIQGGSVDASSVVSRFSVLATDEVMNSQRYLRDQSPIYDFLATVQSARDPRGGGVSGFSEWMAQNGKDFGWFQRELRPALSGLAQDLFANPSTRSAGKLTRDLIAFIDGDMVDQVAKSNPEIAQAAREAKRFYEEEFAPLFREGVGARYAEIYEGTLGRTGSGVDYGIRSDKLLRGALSEANPAELRSLEGALKSGQGDGLVANYLSLDVVNSYGTEIRLRGLDASTLGDLQTRMLPKLEALREVAPEQADQLDQFIRAMQDGSRNKTQLAQELEQAAAQAERRQNEILKGELSTFFAGADMATTTNATASFEGIFRSKEAVGTLQKLRGHMDGLPAGRRAILERGLQTTYSRHLREALINPAQGTGGVNAVSGRNIVRASNDQTALFRIGDEIFKDAPEVMQTIRGLSEIAQQTSSASRAKPIRGANAQSYGRAAAESTNRMINVLVGPLSRGATQARTVFRAFLDVMRPDEVFHQVTDNILMDPNEFLRLAREVNKAPRDMAKIDAYAKFLTRGFYYGVTGEDDDEELDVLREMNGFMSGVSRGVQEAADWLR
ncbi:hypothetical protein WLQ66_09660 [Phaeobacter sp. A36a-5a]|uniref:hypothetical protein n=2 Tax=Phaeobacter bryozoorum TaxID=1086632 RepID=UPI0030C9F097